MAEKGKQRPGKMRLIDATSYRLPLAAYVSILHRASGLLMFILLPFLIWLLDKSLSSEITFGQFTSALHAGLGFVPGWAIKVVLSLLMWAFLHHFVAGLRHLWMDISHAAVSKENGKSSAIATFAISIPLWLLLTAKLFGLF